MTILLSITIMLAPIVAWAVYRLRTMHRESVQAERDALPFEPKHKLAQHAFLSRFSRPQRALIEEQLTRFPTLYAVLTWLFAIVFSIAWLPLPWKHATWSDSSAYVWFQYLQTACGLGLFFFMLACITVFLAITPLLLASGAQFYRTRPVGLGFQFWLRVLCALAVLLASAVTGIALSFALLALVKGPVWQHLPPAFPGTVTGPGDYRPKMYQAFLSTSAPRLFLSIITTITLFFSATLALFTVPAIYGGSRSGVSARMIPLSLACATLIAFDFTDVLNVARWPRQLNFYTHLGPPPDYIFVVVAILLSVALFLLARVFIGRSEV